MKGDREMHWMEKVWLTGFVAVLAWQAVLAVLIAAKYAAALFR